MLGLVRERTFGVGLGGTAFGLALGAEHPIIPAEKTPRPPPRSHHSLFLTKPPQLGQPEAEVRRGTLARNAARARLLPLATRTRLPAFKSGPRNGAGPGETEIQPARRPYRTQRSDTAPRKAR